MACRGERVQVGERKFGAVLFLFGFFSEFFFFSLLAFSFESSSPFSRERQRSFQSEWAVKRNRSKKRRVVFVRFCFSFFRFVFPSGAPQNKGKKGSPAFASRPFTRQSGTRGN